MVLITLSFWKKIDEMFTVQKICLKFFIKVPLLLQSATTETSVKTTWSKRIKKAFCEMWGSKIPIFISKEVDSPL